MPDARERKNFFQEEARWRTKDGWGDFLGVAAKIQETEPASPALCSDRGPGRRIVQIYGRMTKKNRAKYCAFVGFE